MFDEAALVEKLRKIEALFEGVTTDGERAAAAQAAQRITERIAQARARGPDIELMYTLHDPWSRRLFSALCRRYGLRPYRYTRQRRTSLCVRAPRSFLDKLWTHFCALDEALGKHLEDVTERVIRAAIHDDTSEAAVVADPPKLPWP